MSSERDPGLWPLALVFAPWAIGWLLAPALVLAGVLDGSIMRAVTQIAGGLFLVASAGLCVWRWRWRTLLFVAAGVALVAVMMLVGPKPWASEKLLLGVTIGVMSGMTAAIWPLRKRSPERPESPPSP